ncbi:tape measure protein, partial [Yersinia enterocolitica]
MSDEKNMGGIVFEVDMELGKLLSSQQKVNSQLDQMEGKFDATAKSVDRAEKSMFSLSRVATALSAAISVQQITSYGNAWVTVSNKLVNAVRANEDLLTVTNRVFDISQDTRAGLEATATLYGRLERATRSAGTSTADLAKLTTTINKGLVVSGATAEEASSTMIQLSQALASGVLRGEEFNSISENGSRLAVALADSLGVTVGQLRAMAAEGKLTTDVVVNGLLKQSDAIAKEFGNTVLTMGQAFTVASNNITKFIGESSSVNTGLNIFNQGVIALSENLGTIANIIGVVAAVVGSRYVGALVLATASQVRLAAAAYSAAASQGALATAAKVASGALALVGGPAGFATLAATAIFYFYQKAQEAKKEAIDLADGVNALIAKMKEMSNVQLAAEIGKLNNSLPELSAAVDDAKKVYDKATEAVERNRRQIYLWGEDSIIGGQAADELKVSLNNQAIALNDLTKIQNTHGQAVNGASILSAQLNGTLVTGIDLLRRDGQEASFVTGMMNKLGAAFNFAGRAKDNFNSSSLNVERSADADKILDDLKQENALLAIKDDRQRAITKASQDGVSKGAAPGSNQLRQIEEEAARRFDLQQVKKEEAAATKSLVKEESAAATEAKNRAKQLTDLNNSIEVTKLEIQGQSRAAAQLAAVQKLGSNATREEIDLAKQQAGAIYDLTVQIDNIHKAKQGQQFAQQEITSAQSPMAQIDIEEQAKLAKLAEYQAIDTQNTQLYEDAKTAIQLQASQQRQRILDDEAAKHTQAISDILGAASQGFDGIAGIIDASGGKASSAYKMLFGISKGFAVAQAALNMQTAISNAMALPWPANIPAIAQATAAGGQIASAMSSISYGGGRKNGGGVNADSMYQVGEGGEPELLKASNGKQYMIPG